MTTFKYLFIFFLFLTMGVTGFIKIYFYGSPHKLAIFTTINEPIENEVFPSKHMSHTLPDFNVTTLDGKKFSTSELKGKLVVMNFWFIACKPCIMEIPELNHLVEKYKHRNDIVFIAPALDEEDDLSIFLKKMNFMYQIVPGARSLVKEKFGISAYPTHLIADKEGRITYTTSGYNPGNNGKGGTIEQLAEMIAKELNNS